MAITWEVLDSVRAVEPAVADWDRLAVAAGLPYCSPAWLMAWWRHASPAGARLHVVAVRDGDRLVGVGPFHAIPWRAGLWTYSLLGSDTTLRIEPVVDPAVRHQTARSLAESLSYASPPPGRVRLEGLPIDSDWPRWLCEAWPSRRRPWRYTEPPIPAPTVPLGEGDVDGWLRTRSANFRQQMRRARRKADQDGATFRIASTPQEIERDLVHFERLHNARWNWRGGSSALTRGIDRMLADAGGALIGQGRFLLMSLELNGRVIGCQLFVAAGCEMGYWNGGFDDDFGVYKPSMIGLVEAIRVSLERGFRRFDLGPGAQEFKYRFTSEQDLLLGHTLIPHGRSYPPSRALFAAEHARHAISRRLTREQKEQIKALVPRRGPTPG